MILRKNIIIIYSFLFMLLACELCSQDIHFSQFYTSPLLLNPACAGASVSDFRFAINYRNQWKSVIMPFKTTAIAFDSKINLKKRANKRYNYFGYGFTMFNDKAGLSKLTTNQLNIDLAYHIYLSRTSLLSAGIKTGFFQRIINTSDLKWDAQFNGKTYDSSLPTNENTVYQSLLKFDLGAGLQYRFTQYSKGIQFEIGASLAHITKPSVSFYNGDPSLNFKYIGHTLLQKKINSNSYIIPTAMYALQGKHSELTMGANYKYLFGEQAKDNAVLNTYSFVSSAIQFGAFYRYNDAVIFTTAFEYKHSMLLGVSYDVNVSKFKNASKFRGGIEFSLVFIQLKKSRLRSKYEAAF